VKLLRRVLTRRKAHDLSLSDIERAVIVAMIAMGMMQMPIDEIIDVISMRNSLMPAARTVKMGRVMTATAVVRGATIGILVADLDHMFVDMVAVRMM